LVVQGFKVTYSILLALFPFAGRHRGTRSYFSRCEFFVPTSGRYHPLRSGEYGAAAVEASLFVFPVVVGFLMLFDGVPILTAKLEIEAAAQQAALELDRNDWKSPPIIEPEELVSWSPKELTETGLEPEDMKLAVMEEAANFSNAPMGKAVIDEAQGKLKKNGKKNFTLPPQAKEHKLRLSKQTTYGVVDLDRAGPGRGQLKFRAARSCRFGFKKQLCDVKRLLVFRADR